MKQREGTKKRASSGKTAHEPETGFEPLVLEEENPRSYGIKNLPDLGGLTQLIKPALLAILISWAMITFLAIPKGDYREDITRLELDLVAIRGADEILSQRVTSNSQFANKVGILEGQINALSGNFGNYATLSSVESLSNLPTTFENKFNVLRAELENDSAQNITELEAIIATFESRVKELESKVKDPIVVAKDRTTRWTLSVASNRADIDIRFSSYPSRIEDEGDYSIDVILTNVSSPLVNLSNVILYVTLTPQRNDRVLVDENDIFLDTYSYPYTRWNDINVIVRSDGTVKRITFTSEGMSLSDSYTSSNPLYLDLDFTLEYN